MLSVVIPSYREEGIIEKAAQTISEILSKAQIAYELIFVDDGSNDGTWFKICEVRKLNPNVRGIRFSRNFGKEAAILAGLCAATGDCTAVMDCDLQHPPKLLIDMYKMWQSGIEIVEAVKRERGRESLLRRIAANTFYKFMSKATGVDMTSSSDYKLLDKRVVEVLVSMPERVTFFRAMSSWVGFKRESIEFDVEERFSGVSKWSLISLIKYALRNIVSYSALAIYFASMLGALSTLAAFILLVARVIYSVSKHVDFGMDYVILVSIFLMSGIILIFQGVTGYYISNMLYEIKARPRYIVAEEV